MFFFIKKASLHNCADDNALSSYSSDPVLLIDAHILRVLNHHKLAWRKWYGSKCKKIQTVFVLKTKNTITETLNICIDDVNIKLPTSVKHLGKVLDKKLNFETHTSSTWRSASCQSNALFRLKKFPGFKQRKNLIGSFVYFDFNYCSLVWHFSKQKLTQKIESI